jgi:Peptidase C26
MSYEPIDVARPPTWRMRRRPRSISWRSGSRRPLPRPTATNTTLSLARLLAQVPRGWLRGGWCWPMVRRCWGFLCEPPALAGRWRSTGKPDHQTRPAAKAWRTKSWPSGPGRDARTVLQGMGMPAQPQETQGRRASSMPVERPLIAVSTSEIRRSRAVAPTPQGEPPQDEMALALKYLRAIEAAGGLPVVVPPLHVSRVEALLSRVAGVCLSGGPDLDPESSGERRHALTGPIESELDVYELELARAADARGLPVFAICRGMQVLNVARGGTLHQHLPDVVSDGIAHRQQEPGRQTNALGDARAFEQGLSDRETVPDQGQFVSPPSDREARRRTDRDGLGERRHGRELGGGGPRFPARGAVARRVPDGPCMSGGAISRLRGRRARVRPNLGTTRVCSVSRRRSCLPSG